MSEQQATLSEDRLWTVEDVGYIGPHHSHFGTAHQWSGLFRGESAASHSPRDAFGIDPFTVLDRSRPLNYAPSWPRVRLTDLCSPPGQGTRLLLGHRDTSCPAGSTPVANVLNSADQVDASRVRCDGGAILRPK